MLAILFRTIFTHECQHQGEGQSVDHDDLRALDNEHVQAHIPTGAEVIPVWQARFEKIVCRASWRDEISASSQRMSFSTPTSFIVHYLVGRLQEVS